MTLSAYLNFALALVFVLSLIGGIALVARRFGIGHAVKGGRSRRLALVEVLALDPKRRVVLIRRDHVEHLLLIGPNGAQVVERGLSDDSGAAKPFSLHLSDGASERGGGSQCPSV